MARTDTHSINDIVANLKEANNTILRTKEIFNYINKELFGDHGEGLDAAKEEIDRPSGDIHRLCDATDEANIRASNLLSLAVELRDRLISPAVETDTSTPVKKAR